MLAGILEDDSLLFRKKNADRATEKMAEKFMFCKKEIAKLLPKIITTTTSIPLDRNCYLKNIF